ncbi:hypothetical protein DOTSEDRAFT_37611 [Dothistroma septosporum NZE10]|uniref:DUF7730 domain-containing protein n=1 Tax=Dothistroma septosporum (strain NZE10 / CBS 128990) TaxID=675120 RepID=N1PFI7_DOTSN|nr:hypothetical protein DOTSEDRAFT_37611 [Dothistroma septosporum NZE10]
MNAALPLFRLPQELRDQIYSYRFDKDESYTQSHRYDWRWKRETLAPPPQLTGALRLWVENGDLVTQRTWHNRRLAEPVHDRAAVLRTCRRVYEDTSEYLYGKTMFIIFNSQKYERRFQDREGASHWDEEEKRVAELVSEDARKYFPYSKFPYRPGAEFWRFGEIPPTLWTPARCELLGTLASCTFLQRIQHLRVSIWARKPEDLGKMIAMLQKLCVVLPETTRTAELRLQFTEPRQRSIRPAVDDEEFQQLMAAVARFKALNPTTAKVSIWVASPWWTAAFRMRRMLALRDSSGDICPKPEHPSYDEQCERWNIPYCDSDACERCSTWRKATCYTVSAKTK